MDADSLTALITASDITTLQTAALERALPTTCTTAGHTPLHWAAISETPSILPLLLTHTTHLDPLAVSPDQAGQTPLHWACVSGPVSSVIALLSCGADPAIADAKGYNAVIHAAQYGRVDVLHILLKTSPELAGVVDTQLHTPLMWACYYDHHPAATYLLKVFGVGVDDVDEDGMTALHRAAQGDRWIIVDTLLRHGADWRIPDQREQSALSLARGRSRQLLGLWDVGKLSCQQPVRARRHVTRFALVAFYYVLLAVSYWRYWPIRFNLGIGWSVFAHIAMLASLYLHLKTTFSDPGDIQKGDVNSFLAYIDKCLKEDVSETRLLPSAFCYSCLAVRPQRSKHSRERDICVRRFDHECPWVNNTVGLYTHNFLLLLAVTIAMAEACFIAAVAYAILGAAAQTTFAEAILMYPFSCVLATIHLAICLFCTVLFISHVQVIARGRTTYEHLVAMRENSTQNSYDRGIWNNIIGFITMSGPGTGKPWVVISARTLRDVVWSSGGRRDEKFDDTKELLEQV